MARKALSRVKDVPLLQLIARVAAAQRQGTSEVLLRAEVLAHCGKFQDAAKAYTSAGGALLLVYHAGMATSGPDSQALSRQTIRCSLTYATT